MDKRNFALDRINYIMLAVSAAIAIIGLVLMSGSGSTVEKYDPEIFSAVRIKVAPVVTFIGFVAVIFSVMRKPKDSGETPEEKKPWTGQKR